MKRLSEKSYWDAQWQRRGVGGRLNFRDYTLRRFHATFGLLLPAGTGCTLLEIGCAGSTWLRYFSEVLGWRVAGLDYSELGCEQARQILSAWSIPGEIFCRDFLADWPDLANRFDLVFSYGLMEHFEDPVAVLHHAGKFCRPGGAILTLIPNLTGIPGWLQRHMNEPIYRLQRSADDIEWARAHAAAGFEDVRVLCVGSVALHNLAYPAGLCGRLLRRSLKLATKASWMIFDATGWHPETRLLSPYFVCVGRRPTAQAW